MELNSLFSKLGMLCNITVLEIKFYLFEGPEIFRVYEILGRHLSTVCIIVCNEKKCSYLNYQTHLAYIFMYLLTLNLYQRKASYHEEEMYVEEINHQQESSLKIQKQK